MIVALVGLVLAVATMVHEAGHWVAVRLKGGRVLQVRIGRGPRVWVSTQSGTEYCVALFPLGGRIVYRGVGEGTAEAVVAVGGAIANLAAALALLAAGGLILGLEQMPYVPGSDAALAYATDTVAAWLWLLPRAVADLVTTGAAPVLRDAVGMLSVLLQRRGAGDVIYFAAAVSTLWAVLNMMPVPGSDGWRLVRALLGCLRRGREAV